MSAGELSKLNYNGIKQLLADSKSYAIQSDIQTRLNQLQSKQEDDITNLKVWATPLSLTMQIQQGHKDTLLRINGIEQILSSKIDKSELYHLQSLSTTLETYSTFKEHTVSLLSQLETNHQLLQKDFDHLSSVLSSLQNDTKSIDFHLSKLAPKKEIRVLVKELDLIKSKLNSFALNSSVLEVWSNSVINILVNTDIFLIYKIGKESYRRFASTDQ